jgi:CheY-specific phosphatase CheX
MNNLQKDILTATMFTIGLVGFISGEFIISSTLFASAAIASNINLNRKQAKAEKISC